MNYYMKKYERIISFIMLFIVSLSQVSAPVAYAAELGKIHVKLPTDGTQNNLPLPQTAIPQPGQGSVLGVSTSLLAVGTQGVDTQQSASQRIPIRMEKMSKKVFRTDEPVTLAVSNPDNASFTTTVTDAAGDGVAVPVTTSSNGAITDVQLTPTNEVKPGIFHVTVTDQSGENSTQDFSWGVLALNTDKSLYHPGETGDLAMAVLNDKGDMVCDAQVTLVIASEAKQSQTDGIAASQAPRNDDVLSTNNGKITVNPQCQKHDFSLQPDYEAHYTFDKAGTYNFQLTATTTNGTKTITDSIQVEDQIPFDVQRVSATRIYPPNSYPMTFNVTAHQDFNGIVTETVPQDFTVTPSTESAQTTQSYANMQTMYLNGGSDPTKQLAQAVLGTGTSTLVMPFHGEYPITQGFGMQLTDPVLQSFYTHYGLSGHDGIDFGLPTGTPLYSVDDGNVLWSGPGDYGITVIIQNSWGKSYYGHLSNTSVAVGQHVGKGQLIGYSGATGEATGPHLHFGMKPNNPDMVNGYMGKIDPMAYLPLGHTAEDTATIGPGISLPNETIPQSGVTVPPSVTPVLGASTVNLSPTPTPATSSAETISVTPTSTATASADTVSITPTPAPTASVYTATPSSPSNTNFSVLDKEIQANEQLANSSQVEKVKVITWQVSLKKGQSTSLGYAFKAPAKSPEFYLLGPLKFYSDKIAPLLNCSIANNTTIQQCNNKPSVIFQEQRQWQIASDDVGVEWLQDTTGSAYNGYSWQYRKKLTIDHTKVNTGLYTTRPSVLFMDGGGDASGDTTTFMSGPNNWGTNAVDSSVHNTGPDSYKITYNAGVPGDSLSAPQGDMSSTAGRVSFYVYLDTAPTALDDLFNFYTGTTYSATPVMISGVDHLMCNDGTTHGTTTLKATTWYRVAIGYTISGTTLNYKIYLNGRLEVTCNSMTLASASPNDFSFGADTTGQSIHIDDIYVDSGSDKSDPGDIHVTAKRPFANGTTDAFTTKNGTVSGPYGSGDAIYVNQRPRSVTQNVESSASTQTETFTLEDATTGDVDISTATILADEAWVYADNNTGSCTATLYNGSSANSTSITLQAASYAVFTYSLNSNSYPSGGYGVGLSSCSSGNTFLAEAGMQIAYIPSTSATYESVTPTFMDPGGDATEDTNLYSSSLNSPTADCNDGSVPAETGPCSYKFSTGGTGVQTDFGVDGILSDSGTRISMYIRFSAFPSSGKDGLIAAFGSGGSGFKTDLANINSSGNLCVTGSASPCGTTTLSTNTWYHLSVSYTCTTSATNQIKLYLNGSLEVNASNTTWGGCSTSFFEFGSLDSTASGNGTNNNINLYVDDIYVDQGTDLSDPGDIHVTAKLPIANGINNDYTVHGSAAGTTCTSGTHCAYINERPSSTSNNLTTSSGSIDQENFNVQGASQGDEDISSAGIIANETWIYAKDSTNGATGNIMNNGQETAVTFTTTDAMYTSIATNANFFANSAGTGVTDTNGSGTLTLEEAGMMIAYTNNNPANTLTNYPTLVNITDTDLKNNAQSSGNDIVFTDSTGRTKLKHEIENYNSSTGALTAWVQVPSLSSSTDTIIYMYYGNPSASDQQNATSVWPTYGAVYHMQQDPGLNGLGNVSFDATAFNKGTALATQLTWNQTVSSSCANPLLIVGTSTDSAGNTNTNVTYNGVGLTKLTTKAGGSSETELWYMVNPPTGANDQIKVTFPSGSRDEVGGSASYCNVNQSSPFGTAVTASGTTTPITATATTTSSHQMVFAVASGNGSGSAFTPNGTSLWNDNTFAGGFGQYTSGTNGTVQLKWTFSCGCSIGWAEIAVPIDAAAGNSILDSTSNANTGSPYNMSSTTGEIYNGLSYNGTDGQIQVTPATSLDPSGSNNFTFETWYKTTSSSTQQVLYYTANGTTNGLRVALLGGGCTGFRLEKETGSAVDDCIGTIPADTSWHHLVIVSNGSGAFAYVDGAQSPSTSTDTTNYVTANPNHFYIGSGPAATYLSGAMDETRVSLSADTPGWISTEYNNENSPSTFVTDTASPETKLYAPTLDKLMKHGEWFDSTGTKQPFVF